MVGWAGVRIPAGDKGFVYSKPPYRTRESLSLVFNGYGGLFSGGKRPEREDHSPG